MYKYACILSKHSPAGHLYADDVQAFVHGPPSDQLALTVRIDALSRDFHLWMSSSRLSLNPNKTQFIWFDTPQQLLKISLFCLSYQCSKPWRSPEQHAYLLTTYC